MLARPLLLATLALAASPSPLAAQGKNLLFYGNSYSFFHGGAPRIVQHLATELGFPTPTIVERLVPGQTMQFHASDPGQVAAISNSLGPGQQWDFVVMQGQSLEATSTLGDPVTMRQSAVQVMANVRAHSPLARAVLFQTWSRASGHGVYPGIFTNPLQMHDQIRLGYRGAVNDINLIHGSGVAERAAVGDAMALLEWENQHYHPDLTHPGPRMTLLTAMCMFTAIYDVGVCGLHPNFQGSGPLVNWLTSYSITESDWNLMAPLADRSSDPGLRQHPGSGDHLLLESGTLPGQVNACGKVDIGLGSLLAMRMSSKNGVFDQAPAWLVLNVYLAGSPPTPSPLFPELQIDPGGMLILMTRPDLTAPLSVFAPLPFTLPGFAVLVQGVAFGPSTTTGNYDFATTDGHVLTFQ